MITNQMHVKCKGQYEVKLPLLTTSTTCAVISIITKNYRMENKEL